MIWCYIVHCEFFYIDLLFSLEEFKNYAKSYLNNMVAQMSKRNQAPERQQSSTSRKKLDFNGSGDFTIIIAISDL